MKKITLKGFILLFFLFFGINMFANGQIFENGEDGKIDRWKIIKNEGHATIVNIYDKIKKSRVIKFEGGGVKSGYEIALNSDEKEFSIDLKTKENFYMEFAAQTNGGIKYLAYTPQNSDYLGTGNFIRHGIGTKVLDGKWHTVKFDLQKDLNEAQKNVKIEKVLRFRIYGNIEIDNLKNGSVKDEKPPSAIPSTPLEFKAKALTTSIYLSWKSDKDAKIKLFRDEKVLTTLNEGINEFMDRDLKDNTLYTYKIIAFNENGESKPAVLKVKTKKSQKPDNESKDSIYENGEDKSTKRWVIYDAYPFGAKVLNVFDKDKNSQVIEFQGNGIGNGYWLKTDKGKRWGNKTQFIFQMDFKFSQDFIFYIEVRTDKGRKFLTYLPGLKQNYISKKYLIFSLEEGLKDGKWHTFSRNLQADLQSLLPNVKLLSVEGVMIRGNGRVDNIKLSSKDNFFTPTPVEPANLKAESFDNKVTLTWEDTNKKRADYKIYRDGKLIDIYKNKEKFEFIDESVLPNRFYLYKVSAIINGIESKGVEVTISTKESKGRIFYVAPNGNDEWSGLFDTPQGNGDGPWKTIQHAVDMAQAGDTVMVRAGRYPGRVVFKHSGNEKEGYIVFRNYPGEKPVIVRDDTAIADTVVGYGVSYIKFIGFHVYKPNRGGIIFYGPGSHIVIKDNEVSESNANIPETKRLGHAINVTARKDKPMSYITIEGNHVHHNHTGNPNRAGAYNEALTVLGNVKYFKIINNEVHDNDFIGIDVIGHQRGAFSVFGMNKYGLVAGNKVYRNGVRKIWASALYVDGAENLIVENNLVYDNFGLGITISQETPESTTDNVIVRHNIGWNNARGGMIGSANRGTVRNSVFVHNLLGNSSTETDLFLGNAIGWRIKNNIFSGEGSAPFMFKDLSGKTGSWIFDYNIYKDATNIQMGGNHKTFSEYQTATGKDQNSFEVTNLYFQDKENYDFHLTKESDAIDNGGFLTTTVNDGEGDRIEVYDASYFTDGYGLKEGDLIKVGDNEPVRVTYVNYATNQIGINKTIKWNKGDGVSYAYEGIAPDIGPFEFKE